MNKPHTAKTAENSPASRRATYQDVLDAPPHMVAQIIDGTLYTQSRPVIRHTNAHGELFGIIKPSFRHGRGGPGRWWIFNEPELHLGDDILAPDIAGWRRKRMPEVPTGAYFTLAPDWVCEVLSPSTRTFDLGDKREIYAREGVGYLWLVDPDAQSLQAFKLRGTKWVLIDELFDSEPVSLPPFETISFDLGDLWLPRTVHKDLPGERTVEPESIGTSL